MDLDGDWGFDRRRGRGCPCGRCRRRRQGQADTGANAVRIGDPGVGGDQFMPTAAATQILKGKLPEGIAGLDAHGPCWRECSGCSGAVGLHGTNRVEFRRNGWSDRLRGTDGNGRCCESRENSGLRGGDQMCARRKIGADNFIEVRTKNRADLRFNHVRFNNRGLNSPRLNDRRDFLWSRRLNIGTGTRTEVFTYIRADDRLNIFSWSDGEVVARTGGNMRTNWNRGERVATKNLRRSFRMEDGLNRRTHRRMFRQNRRRERGSRKGKMEWRGLFRFQSLQFFLLAILASNFAE